MRRGSKRYEFGGGGRALIIYGLNAVRETIATAPSDVEELFIATVGEEGGARGAR